MMFGFRIFSRAWRGDQVIARPKNSSQRLTIGLLEPRQVLTGNVSAVLDGNDLRILGDDEHNFVRLDVVDGDVVLRGDFATTVNGSAVFTVLDGATRLPGAVLVSMGRGDDRVSFGGGLTYTGTIHINGGKDDDHVALDSSTVDADVVFIGGKGNDSIAIRNATVDGQILINTDKGKDTVSLDNVTVEGDLKVDTGKSNDVVELKEVTVSGFTNVLTKAGRDAVLLRESTLEGSFFMSTGRGRDVVDFGDTTIDGQATINLDSGRDAIRFTNPAALPTNLVLNGGRGGDYTNATAQNFSGNRRIRAVESTGVATADLNSRIVQPLRDAEARLAQAKSLFGAPIGSLILTAGSDSTTTLQSSGILLTKQATQTISGTTLAGATIELSRDADGLFNDGTATAGANGQYEVDATLLHNSTNDGVNTIKVRATDSLGRQVTEELKFHLAVGTVVRFASALGNMDFELLDDDAPLTVENFLNYETRFVDSIVHRSARTQTGGDFIIQGGGFKLNGNAVEEIAIDNPVQSEADPANSNIRGTLAMALPPGNPNGGTSQWFINLADNSFLDAQSFTVFGRVIGDGLDVADDIHDLDTFDIGTLVGEDALTETPLRNYGEFTETLTGTVSTTAGSNLVTGIGTSFTTEIPADKRIQIGTQSFTILTVDSDIQLQLVSNATQTVINTTARVNAVPIRPNYIIMSSISELDVP